MGRDFRECLPAERWAAMALFLRSLAARRRCGPVDVGRLMKEYRDGRRCDK